MERKHKSAVNGIPLSLYYWYIPNWRVLYPPLGLPLVCFLCQGCVLGRTHAIMSSNLISSYIDAKVPIAHKRIVFSIESGYFLLVRFLGVKY